MIVQEQKRLDYLDAAKAFALLVVIYGHTFRESMRDAYAWCALSYTFVYRFHVSLLFIVSGIGYALSAERNRQLSASQYLKRKARSLLLPWFSYSVIIYAIFALVQIFSPVRAMLASTSYHLISLPAYAAALLRNENPYSFHLWYLQSLFLFVAATFLIDHFLSPKAAQRTKAALLLLTPAFYILFCDGWIWTFKAFFQKFFCFLLGALIPPQFLERRARPLAAAGILSCLYMLAELFYPPADSIYRNILTGIPLSYLDNLAIIGLCLGILAACILLKDHLHWAAKFGRDTMLYYIYHQPFCCALLGMILYDKMHLSPVLTVIFCMAASIILPNLLRMLVKQLKLASALKKIGLPV